MTRTAGQANTAIISIADIMRKVSEAAFGKPLITNVLRGHVVEAIIATALEPEWTWCSADYAGWDFERADGLRLEVKQSAARQSWTAPSNKSRPSFDIAARTGHWVGAEWIEEAGRAADIYVFAHHDVSDDGADHRSPEQWTFYVIPTERLPEGKQIGINRVISLARPCRYSALRDAVQVIANEVVRGRPL
jgi:hypothetical protein